jgi:hypothetical protein
MIQKNPDVNANMKYFATRAERYFYAFLTVLYVIINPAIALGLNKFFSKNIEHVL